MVHRAPAFSFYAKDFLLGTVTMSLSERGAYITLLSYQWDMGGIPDDATARARLLACSPKQADVAWAGIASKFEQGADGQWRNRRLELERTKQAERRAALAANGTKGGRPKKANRKPTETNRFPKAKANGNQNQSLPSSSSLSFSSSESSLVPEQPENGAGVADPDLDTSGVTGKDIRDFIARFCELYSKHRHGARYMVRREKDVPLVRRLLLTYPAERLEKLAVILLTTDDDWVSDTDRGIGILSVKVSRLDGLLAEHEAKRRAS